MLLVITLVLLLASLADTTKVNCTDEAVVITFKEDGCQTQEWATTRKVCSVDDDGDTNTTVCASANITTYTRVLSCFNGYQEVNSSVSDLSETVSTENCTEAQSVNPRGSITSDLWSLSCYRYLQPIIVIMGLGGNTLSFLVMSSKYMRQFSFSLYLRSLAIIDSLVLLHYGMTYWDSMDNSNRVFRFRFIGYYGCLIYPYLVRVAQLSSVWCVVAFTVDRAIAVCKPFFALDYITVSRSRFVVAIVILGVMLTQVYHIILLDVETKTCHDPFSFPLRRSEIGAMEIMVLISRIGLLMLLPFLIVLVCNVNVIMAVKRRSSFVEASQESSSDSSLSKSDRLRKRRTDAENKMSLKLFSVSITFLLLSLPDAVQVVLDFGNLLGGVDKWYKEHKNYRPIARMIFSLNFAINYLLYGLAFRKQVLLCSKFHKGSSWENSSK